MAGLSKAERRRHDQKVTLPSSLFLPLGRGMNNIPQEEGCSNNDSTMSVSSEPTEVHLENNSRAPAGLHTSTIPRDDTNTIIFFQNTPKVVQNTFFLARTNFYSYFLLF